MKTITFDNPSTTVKLTVEQANNLGINITEEVDRGQVEYSGPWQIITSFKALCISANYSKVGLTKRTKLSIHGQRKLSNLRQGSYELEGYVSINGKKYSAFTSSQLFEVDGKLIDVSVIHARI